MKKTTAWVALIGILYALGIGFMVERKIYSAAAAIFVYGLALALGRIIKELQHMSGRVGSG